MATAEPGKPGSKDVEAEGDACGVSGAAAPQQQTPHPFWEDSVFPDGLPPEKKAFCRYRGFPVGHVGREPLLLAVVKGEDEQGKPFEWIARRSRKRVLQPYECPTPQPPISWLGGLRWKPYAGKPSWWVAVLFAVGSVLFLITGIARETRAVSDYDSPPGIGSLTAGLAVWPELVACYFLFFPATILQVVEATNMDLDCRLKAWKKGGQQGLAPGPRLLPTRYHLRTTSYWAAAVQVVGMLCFNTSITTDLVNVAQGVDDDVLKWAGLFTFMIGGACFAVGSWIACIEETGCYWRGLVPSRWADVQSISWVAVFCAFWGSLGFTFQGAAFFAAKFSWTGQQIIILIGQVIGSVLFLLSALAGLLEQANPAHL